MPAAHAEPTPAMVVDEELRAISFAASDTLTADERARISALTLAALASNHANVIKWYGAKAAATKREAADPTAAANDRRNLRLAHQKALGTSPAAGIEDVEARIVASHDPVVAYDSRRNLLFTRRSVADLRLAATWTSALLDLPGPTATFDADVSTALARDVATMAEPVAAHMMFVAAAQANAEEWLRNGGPKTMPDYKSRLRTATRTLPGSGQNWQLAEAAGAVASTMSDYDGASMHQRMSQYVMKMYMVNPLNPMNRLNQQMRTGNLRQMGSTCMSGAGSVSYCAGQ